MADIKRLDPELETEAAFVGGKTEDPDRVVDSESLGARHRRRFGYTAEGAQENDSDIADQGRKPLKVTVHRSAVPESRMSAFSHGHGMAVRHIETVKKR